MLCQRLPSPSTTPRRLVLQNLPSLGLPALIRPPPIWRVLNKLHCKHLPNNEALQWAKPLTSCIMPYDIRGSKFKLIIETLKLVQSWLY